jgi:hypothetical protein
MAGAVRAASQEHILAQLTALSELCTIGAKRDEIPCADDYRIL